MKRYITPILLLFACLSFAIPVEALTKAEADKAYRERNYQQAITDYEHLLKAGESASLYYNLGNAYFRTDNVTKAILNYERALLLDPGNRDIRFNLQFAKSKTIDKFADADEMFFVTWYREIVNFMSVDGWAITSIFTIILALLGFLVYLFIDAVMLKKVGFIDLFGIVCSEYRFCLATRKRLGKSNRGCHRFAYGVCQEDTEQSQNRVG